MAAAFVLNSKAEVSGRSGRVAARIQTDNQVQQEYVAGIAGLHSMRKRWQQLALPLPAATSNWNGRGR